MTRSLLFPTDNRMAQRRLRGARGYGYGCLFSCTSSLPPTSVLVLSAPHFLLSASKSGSKLRVDLELVCYKTILFDVIDLIDLVSPFSQSFTCAASDLNQGGVGGFHGQ